MADMEENRYLIISPQEAEMVEEKFPPEEELQDLAEFFKVFGDLSTRLQIFGDHLK